MASAPPSAQLSRPLLPRVGRDADASPVVDEAEETTGEGGTGGPVGGGIGAGVLVEDALEVGEGIGAALVEDVGVGEGIGAGVLVENVGDEEGIGAGVSVEDVLGVGDATT